MQQQNDLRPLLMTAAMVLQSFKYIAAISEVFPWPDIADNLLVVLILALLGLKLITQHYTFAGVLAVVSVFAITVYTSRAIAYSYPIFTVLCIFAMQDVDLAKVMRATAYCKLLLVAGHVGVYLFDLARGATVTWSYRAGQMDMPRMTFYLGHANTASMYVMWATLELLYSMKDRLCIRHVCLAWLLNFGVYQCCDSNTVMIMMNLMAPLIILHLLLKDRTDTLFDRILHVGVTTLYPVLAVFFVVLVRGFVEGRFRVLFYVLNRTFTGRLLYGAIAYDMYGFTFFGKLLRFPGKVYWRGFYIDNMLFDNCYLWLVLSGGIFYLVLLSVCFFIYGRRMRRIDRIFVLAFILYSIMESYVMNCSQCFALLILGYYVMGGKHEEQAYDTACISHSAFPAA